MRYKFYDLIKIKFTKLIKYLKKKDINISKGLINLKSVEKKYYTTIIDITNSTKTSWKLISAIVIFSVFSYILVPLGFIPGEFFPADDYDIVYINLELPLGTNSDITENITFNIFEDIKDMQEINFSTIEIGSGNPVIENSGGDHSSLITLNLKEKKMRNKTSISIVDELREKFKNYNKGKISVSSPTGGPPVGSDIEIKLLGNNLQKLDKYANNIIEYLSNTSGIVDTEKSIKQGTSKLVFSPDLHKLSQHEIGIDEIGYLLRTLASGNDFDDIKINNKDTDIVIRLKNNVTPENISNLHILKNGINIPIQELGKFVLKTNPTSIKREDKKRTLSVSATVKEGYNIQEINAKLENFAKNELNLPNNYNWKVGGQNEENQESVTAIYKAMGLSFILILVTMVIQFKSYRKSLIVMLVIPLAISGVFIIFALTQTPLSFPALIGILALFGIVVNNSMVIVDKINQNINLGVKLKDAIAEASSSRLEPILLTSTTTILGLIPITLKDAIWRGLGGAIISGLLFSGVIMLLFIPTVYYLIYKNEYK